MPSNFGSTPTSTTTLGTNQFPISSGFVPNTASGNLTSIQLGPSSTDTNGYTSAPVAVYIADGNSLVEGLTTDTAVTGDVSGSISAKLRGLSKIFAQLQFDGSNFLKVNVAAGTVATTQSGTWNINNISGTVSLPTGAATSAKQPALGTAGSASADVITVQGIASMTPLAVSGTFWQATQPVSGSGNFTVVQTTGSNLHAVLDSGSTTAVTQATASNLNAQVVGSVASAGSNAGNPVKVGGAYNSTQPTVTTSQIVDAQMTARGAQIVATGVDAFAVNASQSGTWNITNVSGTVSLPTGAATSVKQPALGTAGSASTDVLTVQGIASMTALKVDGSAVTQPVSGTVTANAGTGTFTNQQSNVTADYDTGAGTQNLTMFGIALPASGGAVSGGTSSNPVRTDPTGATTQPVSIASLPALPSHQSTNVDQWNGTTVDTNSGNKSAGTVRVVIATDQPSLSNALSVSQSGTWTVTANAGTNLNTSALALDTSVNGILLGQASTTSGQKGSLIQGAVTTNAPTYTTAQTNPLSLDTSGLLRVSLKDTPANTNNLNVALAASSATVTVSASGNFNNASVGSTGSAVPASASYIGGNKSGNLTGLSLDGSGNLNVNVAAGSSGNAAASATGSAVPANADYTGINVAGTLRGQTGVNPSGSIYAGQMDLSSVAGTTADTNSGNKSAGTLRVVLATDQPTLTNTIGAVTQASGPWTVNTTQIAGSSISTAASGVQKVGIVGNTGATVDSTVGAGSAPTNALIVGSIYNSSAPAPTSGQAMAQQADQAGNLRVFPGVALTTLSAWNSSTSLNATQNIFTNSGTPAALVQLTQTTTITAGAATFEVTYDGSNWSTIPANDVVDPTSTTFAQISLPYTLQANTNKQFLLLMNGAQGLRVKLSTQISGTGTVTPNYILLASSPLEQVVAFSPTAANFQVTANAGTNLNTSLLALESGGNLATLAGGVTSSKYQVNVAQINGVAPTMNNGVSGTGVQRVTIASDSTGQVTLAAGANTIGALTANQTVNVAQVAGGNTSNAGQTGAMQVGGAVATNNNVSSATNPLLIAGSDYGGTPKVQSLKVDSSGNAQVAITNTPTVTANIGTSGSLALDATVTKLNVAQSAALGSNTGPMMQGSVTTNAPSYSTGNINPLSLDTSGLLRVSIKDTPANTNNLNVALAASSATVTVTATNLQTNLNQIAGSAISTAASGVQKVGVVGNSGATIDSAIGAGTAPTNAVITGAVYNSSAPAPTNGQAMALQVDQAGNIRTFPGIALTTLSAWNSGTSSNTTQTIFTNSGASAVLIQLDQTTTITGGAITFEANYDGTNWITPPANTVLDPTSATYAQLANPYTLQASTNKPFLICNNGWQQFRIRLSTVITGTGAVTPYYALLAFNPVEQSIVYSPTATNFQITVGAALPAGGNTIGAVTQASGPWTSNLTQIGGSSVVTGGASGLLAVAGPVASGASNADNPLKVGGAFNTTQPTVTTGQIVDAQYTARGAAIVATGVDAFAVSQSGTWNINNISGTISLPTGAALDTSVNGILVAQASTTSGQKGPLIQGAVTTNAPSYTTAQTSPLSLDTSGLLRASLKDTPSNTNNLNINLAASAATVTVTATNLQTNVAQIGGTNVVTGGASGLLAVGGPVASGSSNADNPVKTGGAYNSTQPTVTTGQIVDAQMTARGAQIVATGVDTFTVIANAGTNLNTSALALESGGNLATLAGGVTSSKYQTNVAQIGGTNVVTGGASGLLAVGGPVASGASNADNPIKVGGVYNSTQPTVTTGQVVDLQATSRGALIVATGTDTLNTTVNTALPAGTNIIGKFGIDQTTIGTTNGTTIVNNNTGSATSAEVTATKRLRVQIDSTQIFYDAWDSGTVDTTYNWNAAVTGGNGSSTPSAGQEVLSSGTTASGYAYLTSKNKLQPVSPGYLQFDHQIQFTYPLPAHTYAYWGAGTVPATPTSSAPLTDAVAFELATNGKMSAVCYAGGTRNSIQDLSSATGNNTQPTDANVHKYEIYLRGDNIYWLIDNQTVTSIATGALGPNTNLLPIMMLSGTDATGASSAQQLTSAAVYVGDTSKAFSHISDPTHPQYAAAVKPGSTAAATTDPSLVIGLSPNSPLPTGANTIGAVTQASGPWTENLTQIAGSSIATAATGVQKVGIVGNTGATIDSTVVAGTAPTNAIVSGIIYNSSAPAPTTGQAMALQADQAGNTRTFPGIALATLSAWNSSTSLNATQNIFTNSGAEAVLVQLTQTTTLSAGAITFEVSYDNSNWSTIPASAVLDPTSTTFAQISLPYTVQASTNKQFLLNMNGAQGLRIKLSTQITGSGTVTPNYALLPASPADTVITLSPTAANFNATVVQSGTWTVQPGNTPNTTAWLVSPQAATSGGATTYHLVSASGTNATNVKNAAGLLYGFSITNTNASARYVHFYNTSSAPTVGTTTPVATVGIPGSSVVIRAFPVGATYGTGISFGTSTGAADNDSGSVGSGDLVIDLEYK